MASAAERREQRNALARAQGYASYGAMDYAKRNAKAQRLGFTSDRERRNLRAAAKAAGAPLPTSATKQAARQTIEKAARTARNVLVRGQGQLPGATIYVGTNRNGDGLDEEEADDAADAIAQLPGDLVLYGFGTVENEDGSTSEVEFWDGALTVDQLRARTGDEGVGVIVVIDDDTADAGGSGAKAGNVIQVQIEVQPR